MRLFVEAGVRFAPGKSFDYTEERLAHIMRGIHDRWIAIADEYGNPASHLAGANIAGFT